jgi:hypothetical protein
VTRAYYDGCVLYYPTNRSQVYTRPDGTTYSIAIGDGTAVNMGDKCVRTVETQEIYVKDVISGSGASVRDTDGNVITGSSGSTITTNLPTTLYGVTLGSCPSDVSTTLSATVYLAHYKASETRTAVNYPDGTTQYTEWVVGTAYLANTDSLSASKTCTAKHYN